MKEKYTYYKREREEQEIDLIKLASFVLLRWRVIVLAGVIGVILGLPVGLFMANRELLNTDDLSPSIMAQLDNYAQQKELNQKLNEDDRELYIMSLNPEQTYFDTKMVFTIRTDKHEDVELATKMLDISDSTEILEKLAEITGYDGFIKNLNGLVTYTFEVSEKSSNSGMNYLGDGVSTRSEGAVDLATMLEQGIIDEETAEKLNEVIGGNGGQSDINDVLSSLKDGKSYAILEYNIKYLTKEQTEKFSQWMNEKIQEKGTNECANFSGYEFSLTKQNLMPVKNSDIKKAQQEINNAIATRETSADIAVETLLAKYATNISASATTDGSPAIIDGDEKEMYQMYWNMITDDTFENEISKVSVLKWMVIAGVGCVAIIIAVYALLYIAKPATVDERMLREDYKLPIIGYVSGEQKKGLDKVFSFEIEGNCTTDGSYIKDILADSGEKVILVHLGDKEANKIVEKLSADVNMICGNIMTSNEILNQAKNSKKVYLLVESGMTIVDMLDDTLRLLDLHEIELGGIIVAKI